MAKKKQMEIVRLGPQAQCDIPDLAEVSPEIDDWERERFAAVIDTSLTTAQQRLMADPETAYPRQDRVLAVHWHPEYVPMDLVARRIDAMYPNRSMELIIPTQHNELLPWGERSGVEVDCYSSGFNRKVQLLVHFRSERLEQGADKFKAMLAHTFRYRSSQLLDLMDSLTEPALEERRQEAAGETGAGEDLVELCRLYTVKLRAMLEEDWSSVPAQMVKNKLVRNFFDTLRARHGDRVIGRAQVYIKAVKTIVKRHFSLEFFYRASEVIEEARSLGAGIVIPHPEQFWPILLADYDVDGIEVWNPQSREYTDFLVHVVHSKNLSRRQGRELLVFMGDDCHLGEKLKSERHQDPAKAAREIGYQPAWDDMAIRKGLIKAGMDRRRVIEEYSARLG